MVVSMSSTYELVVALAAMLSSREICVVNVEHSGGIGVRRRNGESRLPQQLAAPRRNRRAGRPVLLARPTRVIAVSQGVRDRPWSAPDVTRLPGLK